MPVAEKPRFFIVNAVWGAEYVDVLTRVHIPALLASDNLPALPNLSASEILIFTTEADEERIRAHPAYRSLERLIKVVFLRIAITSEPKYDLMNRAHSGAIRRAREQRGYCIFLAPDALMSNGMLARLYELCAAGRRVVAGFGPRLDQEATIAALVGGLDFREGEALDLSPRDLVSLAMRHLHGDFLAHFVDAPNFPQKPYCCAWRGPDGDGMLVRSLGFHPYLFDSRLVPEHGDLDNATIDHNLIPRFVSDLNSFYVETDSDNFSIYGLTPSTVRAKPDLPGSATPEQLSLWLLRNEYSFMNRAAFAYSLRFHAWPTDAAWDNLLRDTQEFALDVIDPSRSLLDWTRIGYAIRRSSTLSQHRGTEALPQDQTAIAVRSTPSLTESPELAQTPFFFTIAIWGQRYVDYFARWAIPSLLAPNNIPGLPNRLVSKFLIATTAEDENRIRDKPEFKLLERFIEVQFAHFPIMASQSDKYAGLRIGHSWGARSAMGKGFVLFLGPDAIYPDGMFSALYRRAAEGKEVVVGMGPRVIEESIAEELSRSGRIDNREPLIVPSREAAALLMRHMHEDVRRLRWTSPLFAPTPYMCVWDVGGGDGLLIRPFSLHPYIVDYRRIVGGRGSPEHGSVIDGTYTADCLFTWDKVHQVTDSDEFVVLSITPADAGDFGRQINPDPFSTLAKWARRTDITMLHRLYFMQALKVHVGDLDDRWRQLEQETLDIAYRILSTAFGDGAPSSDIDTPQGAAFARYSAMLDTMFDQRFVAAFDNRFDERFIPAFRAWFDNSFEERFIPAFRAWFDNSFEERFETWFDRRFDERFGAALGASFEKPFSVAFADAVRQYFTVRGIAKSAMRRVRRRLTGR